MLKLVTKRVVTNRARKQSESSYKVAKGAPPTCTLGHNDVLEFLGGLLVSLGLGVAIKTDVSLAWFAKPPLSRTWPIGKITVSQPSTQNIKNSARVTSTLKVIQDCICIRVP